MKKRLKKILSLVLAVVMLVTSYVALPVMADAAVIDAQIKTVDFWVSCTDAQSGGDLGTVRAHYLESTASGNVYLFLPSQADLNNIKVLHNSSSCTITPAGGSAVSFENGAATDIFAGGINGALTYNLNLGGTSYNLVVYKSANIGAVYINTESGNTDNIDYSSSNDDHTVSETGTIMVVDEKGGVDYNGVLEKIQGRGNGTWSGGTKLPYNIKLQTSTSLLGMGKAKKWVLLANAGETSLIRNWLTYDFSKFIGVPNQVIGKPVDVYANGKYMGNYTLAEKVEIKSNRVAVNDSYEALEMANGTTDPVTGVTTPADISTLPNIAIRAIDKNDTTVTFSSGILGKPPVYSYEVGVRRYSAIKNGTSSYTNLKDPADLTGGYLFELEISDRWYKENSGFCSYSRQCWVVKSHDYISRHQSDYCNDLLYAMGSAVYQSDGNVPSESTTTGNNAYRTTNYAPDAAYRGKHWSDILDADSAVKYYWTQEYFKNMDASTSSTYFSKDIDSVNTKVVAGPVWDMDNAIGYGNNGSRYGYSYTTSDGWYVRNQKIYKFYAATNNTSLSTLYNNTPYTFYAALSRQNDFWEMAQEEWYKTIAPATEILLGNKTDSTGTLKSVDEYVDIITPSATMNHIRYGLGEYKANDIKNGFKTWFSERNDFINGEFGKVSMADINVSAIPVQTYTGSEIKPVVTATYNSANLGTMTLEEGVHYTLSYNNNIEVGSNASVTLTGIGRFAGTARTIKFSIAANDISSGSLSVYDAAYIGDEIEPTLTDANGVQITGGVTYEWFVNGVSAGSGAAYTVKEADAGKIITAKAVGDGVSVKGTLTSNDCAVADTARPSGTVKNIATFSYKYGNDGLSLQGGKNAGYNATAGIQKDTAKLYASVDGTTNDKLEWSGSDTFIRTDGTTGQQPVMSPSNNTPWQEYPYFDVTFSTEGYSDVTFKADIGATAKGAAYYAIMYSVNGGEFDYIYTDEAQQDFVYFELGTTDRKVMKTAFDLTLPEICNNKESVTARVIVIDEYTVDGNPTMFTSTKTSGKIAINNVYVDGVRANDFTGLDAPVIETAEAPLFKDDTVEISDVNAGADVFYTLTDETGKTSEVYAYTDKFAPFGQMSGSSLTVTAWSESGIYKSAEVQKTYTFAGDALARFDYQTYSSDVINGAVPSNGGSYGESSLMKTVADGTTQYVPLYNADKKAFAVSPDDGLKWTAESGFYFELCTGGYESINFSCDAYTTAQGPNSMTLSYSTDGQNWTVVEANKKLPAAGVLENYMKAVTISGIENASKVYIRLATEENLTSGGAVLHNNLSKGNVYINNIIIGGTEINGVLKTPYTNKTSDYFGPTGFVKYYSPDNAPMQYTVTNSKGEVVSGGAYPQAGIQLAAMPGFSNYEKEPYTLNVWAGDDDDKSAPNVRTYYYKGDTIAEFDYGSTKFANSVSTDSLSVKATLGNGTLAMYPNGTAPTELTYTSSYGVKVSASAENTWASDTVLNNSANKGYWLVKTSTLGYYNLTMSLEQVTSNKGPRDWGIAYSTDGVNFTYLENSNSRAIENQKTVQTYSNIALPAELENQETVYIKVFINGAENLAGYELADPVNSIGKGNTGINSIELCGITEAPDIFTASIKTTVLETLGGSEGTMALSGVDVYVDDVLVGTTNETGEVICELSAGEHTVYLDNGTFNRTVTITGGVGASVNVPMVALDTNKDGCVNARDYALMMTTEDSEHLALYKQIFMNFINIFETDFVYADLA